MDQRAEFKSEWGAGVGAQGPGCFFVFEHSREWRFILNILSRNVA